MYNKKENLSFCIIPAAEDDSWKKIFYAPMPDYVHYICSAVLCVLLTLGIAGNSCFIWLYFK